MLRHNHRIKLMLKKDTTREQKEGTKTSTPTNQRSRQSHDQLRSDTQALGGIPPPTPTLIMMNINTWKIRGLNDISKQRILRDCIKAESPDILMLQETKCAGMEAETIFQRIWKGCNYIQTDSLGASGGLAILWNPSHTTLSGPFSTIGTLSSL